MGIHTRVKLGLAIAALAAVLGAGASPLGAQGTGTVRGRVTASGTQAPLAGVQVTVAGTGRRAVTGSTGEYTLSDVPAGARAVRAELLGYATAEERAEVAAGGVATVNFQLGQSAVAIDALVVTGTPGETRQRALGTTVSRLQAVEVVEKAPVTNLSELLNGRVAGVAIINTTGQLGGGNRVRIRGAKSFSLSNEPLVYIDGVRVNNDQATGPANQAFGSRSLSRWNDINPEDIESIEIIKGPAAATLYGTEASAGVIQIITKRGRTGAPRISATLKQGSNWFANPEGRLWTNYFDVGNDGNVESIDIVELEKSRGNAIWQRGHIQEYDVSVGGGSDAARYYVGSTFENSTGVDPDNRLRMWGGRANVTITPSPTWDVNASVAYRTGRTNIGLDAGGGGLTWTTFFARPDRLVNNDPRRGFYSGTPESYIGAFDSWQDLARTTISLTVNHRPFTGLSQRLTLGQDLTREQDTEIQYHDRQWVPFFSFSDRGYKEQRERNVDYATADYAATLQLPVGEGLISSTSVGGQLYRRMTELLYAYGENFPVPGLTSIAATTQNRTNSESAVENVTVGVFAQQQFSWQDRLFLTAALRADDNSAFGEEFDLVRYPKVSAAWVVSEEPFWNFGFVNTLKLRGAYGESGQQPEAFTAIRTFAPVTGPGDVGTVTPQNLGNPKLGPERGKEVEMGFDASLLNERLNVEFTYYNQRTTDAILEREIAPSSGFSGLQFVNAGEIRNRGVELLVRGEPWRTERHGLELALNLSTNDNEVVSLGDITTQNFINAGTYLRHQIGYPVGSWFSRRVVSAELDSRGVARNLMCDDDKGGAVACANAPFIYLGRTTPDFEGGFNSTLRLFGNVEIFGQLDFKTGFSKLDGNLRVRCYFFSECRENWFPREFEPARIAEIQAAGPYGGTLIDRADFLKFRELSLGYQIPGAWAQRFGAGNASIRVAGRNLYTWTKFGGLEPESAFNGGTRGGQHSLWEQNVLPQLQQMVVSLNVSF